MGQWLWFRSRKSNYYCGQYSIGVHPEAAPMRVLAVMDDFGYLVIVA